MLRRGGDGAVRSEQLTLGTMALWAANILGVGFPPSAHRSWCRADETGACANPWPDEQGGRTKGQSS